MESLTAEIGEEFNILEYADPELAAFNDAEHILDGLELADDVPERHAKREPEYVLTDLSRNILKRLYKFCKHVNAKYLSR